MHPGQFTQIGSPNQRVVDASIRELEYHCEMMDRMGLGPGGVMVIHMGVRTTTRTLEHRRSIKTSPKGVYGDKQATLMRFKQNYSERLSDRIKQRLVLENDEVRRIIGAFRSSIVGLRGPLATQMCYNLDDLMPICEELNIPIVVRNLIFVKSA